MVLNSIDMQFVSLCPIALVSELVWFVENEFVDPTLMVSVLFQ